MRRAIRDEEKLDLSYRDEMGRASERLIRPIALIYYAETANIVAWCELRQAIRNFRSDRIEDRPADRAATSRAKATACGSSGSGRLEYERRPPVG